MKCLAAKSTSVTRKIKKSIAQNTVDFFLNVIALVLADKYGFGKFKIMQVIKSIEKQAEIITDDENTLDEIKQILKDEYDIVICSECKED